MVESKKSFFKYIQVNVCLFFFFDLFNLISLLWKHVIILEKSSLTPGRQGSGFTKKIIKK